MRFQAPQSSLTPEELAYWENRRNAIKSDSYSTDGGGQYSATPLTSEEQDALLAQDKAIKEANAPESKYENHNPNRIELSPENWWWAGVPNAFQNIKDIGTGVTNLFTHVPTHIGNLYNYEKKNVQNTIRDVRIAKQMLKDGTMTPADYMMYMGQATYHNPLTATVRDALDLMGTPYALKTTTPVEFINAAKKDGLKGVVNQGKKQLKETANAMFENPVDVALDFLPAVGVVNKALKGTKFAKGASAAEKVEKGIAVKNANVKNDLYKLDDQLKNIKKEVGQDDLTDLIKRAEESGDWTGVNPETKAKLKQFSEDYDTIANKYMPATAVDPEHLTVAQNISRKNGITYREAEKQIQALKDSVDTSPVITQRSIQDLGDVGKTNDIINNLRKDANLPEINLPKVSYLNEEKTLIKNVPEDSIISKEATFAGQSKKVQDALGKVAPDVITPNKSGLDIYNDLVVKTGSPQATSDLLRKAGIGGIRGVEDGVTTVFGGKAKGGYNRANDSVNFFKDADETTRAHELFHRLLEQTKDVPKVKTAIEKGLGKDAKLTNDVLEGLTDEFLDYVKTGKATRPELQELFDIYAKDIRKTDKLEGLKALANQGDGLAQQVVEATEKYRKGDLFPITHAGEKASAIADLYRASTGANDLDRIYAGKFSTREFGLTPYTEIANNLRKPSEFLQDLSTQYLGRNIKDELLTGTLNGESIASKVEKNNVYVSRKALEGNNTFEKILNQATTQPITSDAIAIDKNLLKELSNQTKGIGQFFGNQLLNDVQNLGKGSMLASGTYLGANFVGGGINAIMASGLNTLDDFAKAIKTKGQLSKRLGTYREGLQFRNVKTPVLKQINTFNKYTTGGLNSLLDAKMQNIFSEMAAHRQLRERGIISKDRLKAIDEIEAKTLGDIIEGVKAEALLDSTKTTLPRLAVEIGSGVNPFWRWNDTALRSTMYMLNRHPITSNLIMNQVLSRIGFDNEMQNRLNLGVKSDKPFVSYYFDDRTGQTKEASIEWTPMMNSFKLVGTALDTKDGFFKNNLQAPTLAKLYNAFKGQDQYGRALKRAEKNPNRLGHIYDGGTRFVVTDRGLEEQGTRLDEVAATFAKETIGILNAANKVALPIAGGLTGQEYYQPYAQSLFGSFGGDETANNFFSGGDPRKRRQVGDVMNAYLGLYSQPYIPAFQENQPIGLNKGRSLLRKQRYDIMRKNRGY